MVAAALAVAGKSIDPATQSFLTDTVTQVACSLGAVIGGGLAIYGRITAKNAIGSSK